MALISDEYREQNRTLHQQNGSYGSSGRKNAAEVMRLVDLYSAETVLDYGCGKRGLESALTGVRVINYDPAVHGLDGDPEPADIVVCSDVLEHIEPECLDDVLDHLHSKIQKVGLFIVACRPATKTLPDGRNAHLIVKPPTWWLDLIRMRFDVIRSKSRPEHEEVVFWVAQRKEA